MIRDLYHRLPKFNFFSLAAVFLTFLCTEILITTIIPTWKGNFFEALKASDINAFYAGITMFAGLILSLGVLTGLKQFVSNMLALQIRKPLSKMLLKSWVRSEVKKTSDFSQAQTESIRICTENLIFVFREVFISFFIVLGLMLYNLDQPKVLMAALIYTTVIFISAIFFSKPMIIRNRIWQQNEGAYRESLGDIARGQGDFSSKEKFAAVCKSFVSCASVNMCFTLFGSIKAGAMLLVPYAIFAPDYFSGAITFGSFMATAATFELIVANSTIFTVIYPNWIQVRASYGIVKTFYDQHKE